MSIRVGVIGAGSWAIASHLPNFARHDDVEFVAVARRGEAALRRVQDAFGFQFASEDFRDVVSHDLDVVVVASPSKLHCEHALAALESGANVLVEKPVATDPKDAWALVEAARRLGRHVTVAFGWNFMPMLREAKRLMTDVGIGQVEAVSIHMSSPTRELLSNTGAYPQADPDTVPEQETWTDAALSGGGYGQAQLSHALGMSLWLLNQRVSGAYAIMSSPLNAPVELHDAVVLRYDDGAIGTMHGASDHTGAGGNKHQLAIHAVGSEGQFRVDVEREDLWLYRSDGTDIRPELAPDAGTYDCIGPVDTILDLTRGRDVTNWAPIELGAYTVEALDLTYRSSVSGVFEWRDSGVATDASRT
jgi:predicted dehydrogenase